MNIYVYILCMCIVLYVVHNTWNSPFTFSAFVIMVIVYWAQAPRELDWISSLTPVMFTLNQGQVQPYIHQPPLVAPSYLDFIYFCQESGGWTFSLWLPRIRKILNM